jgi:hypothetical protein
VLWVPHILLGVIGAYVLYIGFIVACLWEKALLGESKDKTASRCRTFVWVCRFVVVLLALTLNVYSVHLTFKRGPLPENKITCVVKP